MKHILFFLGFLWLSILGVLSLFAGTSHAQTATLDATELPSKLTFRANTVCIRFAEDGTPTVTAEVSTLDGAPMPTFRGTLTGPRAKLARDLADLAVRQGIGAKDAGAL